MGGYAGVNSCRGSVGAVLSPREQASMSSPRQWRGFDPLVVLLGEDGSGPHAADRIVSAESRLTGRLLDQICRQIYSGNAMKASGSTQAVSR